MKTSEEFEKLNEDIRKLSIKFCLLCLDKEPMSIMEISTRSCLTTLEISKAMKICFKNGWVGMKKKGRGYPYSLTGLGKVKLTEMRNEDD